jgi:hypothetical protein
VTEDLVLAIHLPQHKTVMTIEEAVLDVLAQTVFPPKLGEHRRSLLSISCLAGFRELAVELILLRRIGFRSRFNRGWNLPSRMLRREPNSRIRERAKFETPLKLYW